MQNGIGTAAGFFAGKSAVKGKNGKFVLGSSLNSIFSAGAESQKAGKSFTLPIFSLGVQDESDAKGKLIKLNDKEKKALKEIASVLEQVGDVLQIDPKTVKELKSSLEKGEEVPEEMLLLIQNIGEMLEQLKVGISSVESSDELTALLIGGETTDKKELSKTLQKVIAILDRSEKQLKTQLKELPQEYFSEMKTESSKDFASLPKRVEAKEREVSEQKVAVKKETLLSNVSTLTPEEKKVLQKALKLVTKDSLAQFLRKGVPHSKVQRSEIVVQAATVQQNQEVKTDIHSTVVLLSESGKKLNKLFSKLKTVVEKSGKKSPIKSELSVASLQGEQSIEKQLAQSEVVISKTSAKKSTQKQKAQKDMPKEMLAGTKNGVTELLQFTLTMSEKPIESVDALLQQAESKEVSSITAKVSHAQVRTPLATRLFESQIMQQVSGKMGEAIQSGLHEISLKLRPEHMGEVRIKLQLEGDIVTAKIDVENQQVKQIIESNFQNLKDSLEEHNLHAGNLDVNVGHGDKKEQEDFKSFLNGDSSYATLEDEAVEEEIEDVVFSKDTGRRFGTNSFEYSA